MASPKLPDATSKVPEGNRVRSKHVNPLPKQEPQKVEHGVADAVKALTSWVPSKQDVEKEIDHLVDVFNGAIDSVLHQIRRGPMTQPTQHLDRFSVKKFWDADSTPPALAALSRMVGTRPPQIEAGIVMASLMHDVAYYYGGDADKEKAPADNLFKNQIPDFVSRLDKTAVNGAKLAAMVDFAAVAAGGGGPLFDKSYSWSYGFEKGRGYATLEQGEHEKIRHIAQETFKKVVNQIADGKFELSDVLKAKLAKVSPRNQTEIKKHMVRLAQSLQKDFGTEREKNIPGFE